MSLGPLLPGRLPNSLQLNRLVDQLSDANRQLATLQLQAATGRRLFVPSEDPAAAVRGVFLQSSIEHGEQLVQNVDTTAAALQVSESALAAISTSLNRAKSLALEGNGDNVTAAERVAIADEFGNVLRGMLNSANQQYNGRYLFGGSQSGSAPFEVLSADTIRYNGDDQRFSTYVDANFQLGMNVDGASAFGAFIEPTTSDVDPALTLETRLSDLQGGNGVPLGTIRIAADDGTNPVQTLDVDLSAARTVQDLKTIIEDAFSGGPPTVTVDVDPTSNAGIRLQQSGGGAGTITVSDLSGSVVAARLGIAGTGSSITGSDLDPQLTLRTNLADLNGGTGIGTTTGNGLRIVSGDESATIDIDSATTVEDLFNLVEAAGLDLETGFNDAGNGLVISSRRNGQPLSIGENNGTNATLLGLRTLTGTTTLAELNHGVGVPNQETDSSGNLLPAQIVVQRRDGSTSVIDLKGLTSVQQVLDTITAVDANLTATLNTVGNGISIADASGTGTLTVEGGPVADALGIAGTQTTVTPIVGSDVNPQESAGLFDVMLKLETAIRDGDTRISNRLIPLLDEVIDRFASVRSDVGGRLRTLDEFKSQLLEEDTFLQEELSTAIDADIAEVVTRVTAVQSALQATLQIASVSNSLTILSFL